MHGGKDISGGRRVPAADHVGYARLQIVIVQVRHTLIRANLVCPTDIAGQFQRKLRYIAITTARGSATASGLSLLLWGQCEEDA